MLLIQVREDGLPGLLDPAPRLVGMGLEEAPGNAPLLATLNAALGTTPQLKHAGKAVATVSIGIPHLVTLFDNHACFLFYRLALYCVTFITFRCGFMSFSFLVLVLRLCAFCIPYNLVDGGWSPWMAVSNCSVPCGGGGSQFLVRKCNNPVPANEGKYCEGQSFKIDTCGNCPCEL